MSRARAVVGLAVLLLASAAHGEDVLVQSGEDVAPYSFIPTLARGARETNWAFTGEDAEAGSAHVFQLFVRFDLPAAPAGQRVEYAYAFFYFSFDSSGFGDGEEGAVPATIRCHAVDEPWSEREVTWQNQPAFGPPFDVWPDIQGFQLFFCDATALVQEWLDGARPNHGIALTNPTARNVGMYSFEATLAPTPDYQPSLLIGFSAEGAPPEVVLDARRTAATCATRRQALSVLEESGAMLADAVAAVDVEPARAAALARGASRALGAEKKAIRRLKRRVDRDAVRPLREALRDAGRLARRAARALRGRSETQRQRGEGLLYGAEAVTGIGGAELRALLAEGTCAAPGEETRSRAGGDGS